MNEPSARVRLPVRASRWISVSRQLVIVLPLVTTVFVIAVGIAALTTLGGGLCCLVPFGPAALVGGAKLGKAIDYWFDDRQPGVVLDGSVLSIRMPDGSSWAVDLDRDYEAASGWWSNRLNRPQTGGVRDASEGIHLYLEQEGRAVLLASEDGLATAPEAGVPCRFPERLPEARVRMWSEDLVALILTLGAA